MAIVTITWKQIRALKWARDMAADWKGNQDPKSYDEFDGFIDEVTNAIEQVRKDRLRLRKLLKDSTL